MGERGPYEVAFGQGVHGGVNQGGGHLRHGRLFVGADTGALEHRANGRAHLRPVDDFLGGQGLIDRHDHGDGQGASGCRLLRWAGLGLD